MVDFTRAVATALMKNDKYDYYQEYENLYIFSIYDSPESFGGFDAPIIISKFDGAITNYLELSKNNHAGWLEKIINEGRVSERVNSERKVSPTHQARYMVEHRLIPELLYKEGIGFMGAIAEEDNILNKILLEYLTKDGVENPYSDKAIKVKPFSIKDILIAKITFPEPEEEPLCYESYAFYDTANDRAGYYCLEKGGAIDDQPFLCGWSPDGVHLNYDNCSFDRGELMANMLRLFLDAEDENTPRLTATFNPKDDGTG